MPQNQKMVQEKHAGTRLAEYDAMRRERLAANHSRMSIPSGEPFTERRIDSFLDFSVTWTVSPADICFLHWTASNSRARIKSTFQFRWHEKRLTNEKHLRLLDFSAFPPGPPEKKRDRSTMEHGHKTGVYNTTLLSLAASSYKSIHVQYDIQHHLSSTVQS